MRTVRGKTRNNNDLLLLIFVTKITIGFLLFAVDVDIGESFEAGAGHEGTEGVQLVGRVLVLVTAARQTHSHAERHVPVNRKNILYI